MLTGLASRVGSKLMIFWVQASISSDPFWCQNLIGAQVVHSPNGSNQWDSGMTVHESFQLFFVKGIFSLLFK